jgi:hypothetical protein
VEIKFVHVDGHFEVLGNEMADRMAQVNKDDFEGKREQLIASQEKSGLHSFKLI